MQTLPITMSGSVKGALALAVTLLVPVQVIAQDDEMFPVWPDALLAEYCPEGSPLPHFVGEIESMRWTLEKSRVCSQLTETSGEIAPDAEDAGPRQVGGLNFDDIFSRPPLTEPQDQYPDEESYYYTDTQIADTSASSNAAGQGAQGANFDFDAQMASIQANNQVPTRVDDFDNIYAAREQIALDRIQQEFRDGNNRIWNQCQCVFNSNSCFTPANFDYSQLNQEMGRADAEIEAQKSRVCRDYANWSRNIDVNQVEDSDELDSYIQITSTTINNLESLDRAYDRVLQGLSEGETQIAAEIREQERQRQLALDAQNNSGPSGWDIFGQVLQQYGAEVGDIYSEVGGSLIQDIATDGAASATYNTAQKYGAYDIETPNYGNVFGSSTGNYSSDGGSGSLTLSCEDRSNNICIDYGFSSSIDRDNFARQCASIVSGSCPAGPSCYMTSGGRTSNTFTYGGNTNTFQQSCTANGGSFSY